MKIGDVRKGMKVKVVGGVGAGKLKGRVDHISYSKLLRGDFLPTPIVVIKFGDNEHAVIGKLPENLEPEEYYTKETDEIIYDCQPDEDDTTFLQMKMCRCVNCGYVSRCTPMSDFYSVVVDSERKLKCEACILICPIEGEDQ